MKTHCSVQNVSVRAPMLWLAFPVMAITFLSACAKDAGPSEQGSQADQAQPPSRAERPRSDWKQLADVLNEDVGNPAPPSAEEWNRTLQQLKTVLEEHPRMQQAVKDMAAERKVLLDNWNTATVSAALTEPILSAIEQYIDLVIKESMRPTDGVTSVLLRRDIFALQLAQHQLGANVDSTLMERRAVARLRVAQVLKALGARSASLANEKADAFKQQVSDPPRAQPSS